MHIGMVLGTNRKFPPDIRVEKEMRALANAGHRVTILTRRIPLESPLDEEFVGGQVRVRRVQVEDTEFWAKMKRAFLIIEAGWLPHLEDFIVNVQPEILHVHDFKMVPTVISVAERRRIPVVADLHENMPAALLVRGSNLPLLRKVKHNILNNYRLWRWQESIKLRKCKKVIVVVPEAAERLERYGIEEDKIVVVSNTEDDTTFEFKPENADPKILERYKNCWMVSYIGGVGPHRGLDVLLEGIPGVIPEISNLKVVIVGARDPDRVFLEKEVNGIGIGDYVEIKGWQPFDKVNSFMFASKVCVIPHRDSEHTQTTIPHKLFQAMICARPVLVSSCRPLKRVVEDTEAGCVFRANDSVDLGKKLIYMFRNPEELERMGGNGQRAALGKYAWRHDARRLVEMYAKLDGRD